MNNIAIRDLSQAIELTVEDVRGLKDDQLTNFLEIGTIDEMLKKEREDASVKYVELIGLLSADDFFKPIKQDEVEFLEQDAAIPALYQEGLAELGKRQEQIERIRKEWGPFGLRLCAEGGDLSQSDAIDIAQTSKAFGPVAPMELNARLRKQKVVISKIPS